MDKIENSDMDKIENSDMDKIENEFDIPEDIFDEKTEVKENIFNDTPFISRNTFPFCFYYYSYDPNNIENITRNIIKKLLDIDNYEIYLIIGNKEKDRIRVICPTVYVNCQIAKDIRSLILQELGYPNISGIIPVLLYEIYINPTILMTRIFDFGINKWESYQTFSCILHPNLKTEEIEKKLGNFSNYNQKLTKFTDEYINFLNIRDKNQNVLEEELFCISIGDNKIPDDIKKEVGENLDKSIDWFKKVHPDSILRMIKRIGDIDNQLFLLDFTKSKHKCRLCNLIHISNRQYVTYSNKSKKAFYHCYDNESKDKKHIISFQKPKRGSEVVSIN